MCCHTPALHQNLPQLGPVDMNEMSTGPIVIELENVRIVARIGFALRGGGVSEAGAYKLRQHGKAKNSRADMCAFLSSVTIMLDEFMFCGNVDRFGQTVCAQLIVNAVNHHFYGIDRDILVCRYFGA